MLVSEFNFVVAGIATFAATVGYACSRRLSASLPGPSSDQIREALMNEVESKPLFSNESDMISEDAPAASERSQVTRPAFYSTPTRKETLKRKIPHDGFDEPEKLKELGYPHNLANIYPNKRSRTPSTESEAITPSVTPASTLDSIIGQTLDEDVEIPLISQDPEPIVATPAPEPPRTPSPAPEQASPRDPSPTPAPPSPVLAFAPQPLVQELSTPRTITPRPFTPKPFASSSGGFAAFAGSTSPFATFNSPQQSALKSSRPIWSSGDLSAHPNNEVSDGSKLDDAFKPRLQSEENNALGESKAVVSAPTTKHTHFTGEEEEDVEMELKNVKLYTKRGNKAFAEGVVGHLKLLSNRTTLEERILFRREPLWKVSMNVRVQPIARCTFVPEENVLRLILKENVELPSGESTKDGEAKQELVIYALKPGRSCSKQDFKDFAETLVKNAHFKAGPSTSP